MANEKDLLQNTGMNEAKEDGNRAEKSQESEGKILHNVNDIMDQLMAYGDAVNDAAFSELLEKLPEDRQLEIAGSLLYVRQYSEMPLKLLKAEQLVGGEEAMDRILRQLFNREIDPAYPYLTYQDFLDACGLTEEDLSLA